MEDNKSSERGIKTAVKVFDVIQLIEKVDEPTFTDLTEHVEMADSTLFNYLETLERIGYITKKEGIYHLTLKFLDYGVQVRDQFRVYSLAGDILERTAEETDATVWLAVEQNGKVVYIAREVGDRGIETHVRPGKHNHMHSLAGGKAMLAHFSEERVHEILDEHGMSARTPYTTTSREKLMDELEEIREQGYALNKEETAEGAWAVAAPIIVNGKIHGCIAVPEPIVRMKSKDHRQKIIDQVTSVSNELELKLTYE
jgi:DNA-binding IclR family transcriptional regulator